MRRHLNRSTNRPLAVFFLSAGMAVPAGVLAAVDTFVLAKDVQLVGQVATVSARHEDTLTDTPVCTAWLRGDCLGQS
jgi:hypothetical protein